MTELSRRYILLYETITGQARARLPHFPVWASRPFAEAAYPDVCVVRLRCIAGVCAAAGRDGAGTYDGRGGEGMPRNAARSGEVRGDGGRQYVGCQVSDGMQQAAASISGQCSSAHWWQQPHLSSAAMQKIPPRCCRAAGSQPGRLLNDY